MIGLLGSVRVNGVEPVSGKSGAGNPLLSPRLTEVAWRVQF
jgi:hypothetical protein